MKITGRTWMALALMAIAAGMFINALQWPRSAALFPLTISVFVFALALLEVYLGLFLKKDEKESTTIDFKMATAEEVDIDAATVAKRITLICLWICVFFGLILLVGFPVAVPLFFVLFLKLYAKETWVSTGGLTLAAWAFFYGLFMKLLNTPFDDGWIVIGLQWLGILT